MLYRKPLIERCPFRLFADAVIVAVVFICVAARMLYEYVRDAWENISSTS